MSQYAAEPKIRSVLICVVTYMKNQNSPKAQKETNFLHMYST